MGKLWALQPGAVSRVRNSCRSFLAFLVWGKMLKSFFLCSNGSIFCGVPHLARSNVVYSIVTGDVHVFCCCCCFVVINDVIISFYSNHSAFWSIVGQSTNIPDYSMHSYSRIRSIQRTLRKDDPIMSSLRKQPTFCDSTTDFFAKWRLGNERRNSIPMTRHYPDMGSASDWMKQISKLSEALHSAQLPFLSILLRVTSRHGGHIDVPKQWNDAHVGVPNQSFGSWTLFFCKHFLLSQWICIDSGRVSNNALFFLFKRS